MSVYVVSVVELNGDVQYSADLLLDLGDSTDSAASLDQWLLEDWRSDGERAGSGWVRYSCGTACRIDTARRVSTRDAAVLSKYLPTLYTEE